MILLKSHLNRKIENCLQIKNNCFNYCYHSPVLTLGTVFVVLLVLEVVFGDVVGDVVVVLLVLGVVLGEVVIGEVVVGEVVVGEVVVGEVDPSVDGVIVSVVVFLGCEAPVGVGLVVIGVSVSSSALSGVTDSESGLLVSLSVSVDFPDPLTVSEGLLVSLSRSLKPVGED